MNYKSCFLPACLLLLLISPVYAQTITGTITGVIEDPAGAKIVGGAITAANKDTGVSYRASSNESGVYVLPLLPLGHYEVSVESPGFKTFVRANLTLNADDRLRVDVRMELGSVTEKMTVSAEAPLVESEKATIGASAGTNEYHGALFHYFGNDKLNANRNGLFAVRQQPSGSPRRLWHFFPALEQPELPEIDGGAVESALQFPVTR